MTRRLRSVPVAVAALAFVIAGCGGQPFPRSNGAPTTVRPADSDPTATRDPRAWLLASVRRTSASRTARVAVSMRLAGLSDEAMTMSGIGAVDFANKAMSLSMGGDENGEPSTVDLRVVGGTIYERTGGDWVSMPVGAANIDSPNPASYVTYLQGVSSGVHIEGHETVRGVDTMRYSAMIDLDRAVAHATSPQQRALLAQALAMLGGVKMPTTVWIDADGYLRKMQLTLDLRIAMQREGVPVDGAPKLVVSMELYDFGAPVSVIAPAGAKDARAAAQARAAQSDLRNALTAEKTVYVDNQAYSGDLAELQGIEPSLDWGTNLKVVVGDAGGLSDQVVCLSEPSKTGTVFAIADVASGPNAGTYYARTACPATIDDTAASAMGASW